MLAHRPPRPAAWPVTVAASFGFAVVQLDVTIVNVALPSLGHGLGAGIEALQWVVDAYTLVFAALLLAAGALGDRTGARTAYLAGFGLFALASLACGLAPSAPALIAARAVQGAGAALLVPSSLALLNEAHQGDEAGRARAVGVWTAAGGVSIAAGPILGGLMVASLGWRSIFLANLPACAAGVWTTLAVVRASRRPERPRRLDLPGQALAALALTGLIGGLIEVRALGLASPVVLAGLFLFAAGGAGLVAVERRASAPMAPLEAFAKPAFKVAITYGVLVNLAYYGLIFVLALYLQQARRWTPLQAGLAFLPLTATLIASNLASGWAVGRFGARAPMAAGAFVGALGYLLLLPLGRTSSYAAMAPGFVLIPAGMGLGVPAMTNTILGSVEPERAGVASGLLNAARQAGGAIGVAVFGLLAGAQGAVAGLHRAAAISSALLLCAGVLAGLWIGRTRPAGARWGQMESSGR